MRREWRWRCIRVGLHDLRICGLDGKWMGVGAVEIRCEGFGERRELCFNELQLVVDLFDADCFFVRFFAASGCSDVFFRVPTTGAAPATDLGYYVEEVQEIRIGDIQACSMDVNVA